MEKETIYNSSLQAVCWGVGTVPGMAGYIKFLLWLLLFCSSSPCFGSKLDIQCLRTVKQSVIDPNGVLDSTWDFSNSTHRGFICQFTGVECWHPDENRVLGLRLSNLGLRGQFPRGLENCNSMTILDLSNNDFSGPIPSDTSRQLPPYLTVLDLSNNGFSGEIPISITKISGLNTLNLQSNQLSGQIPWQLDSLARVHTLDLSHNSFSGEIPVSIANMANLNTLNLQSNQLSGQIPWQLESLTRVESFSVFVEPVAFSVADNKLSGPIPLILGERFPYSSFAGNRKLCGKPLGKCKRKWRLPKINDASSIGVAAGFVVGFVVAFYFPHLFVCSRRLRPYLFR